jgi:hypothetical protein
MEANETKPETMVNYKIGSAAQSDLYLRTVGVWKVADEQLLQRDSFFIFVEQRPLDSTIDTIEFVSATVSFPQTEETLVLHRIHIRGFRFKHEPYARLSNRFEPLLIPDSIDTIRVGVRAVPPAKNFRVSRDSSGMAGETLEWWVTMVRMAYSEKEFGFPVFGN